MRVEDFKQGDRVEHRQMSTGSAMFDPVGKWTINVYFDSEVEAKEFQRLAAVVTGENRGTNS